MVVKSTIEIDHEILSYLSVFQFKFEDDFLFKMTKVRTEPLIRVTPNILPATDKTRVGYQAVFPGFATRQRKPGRKN